MNSYGSVYGGMKPADDGETVDTLEQMRTQPLAGTYLLDGEEEAIRLRDRLQREIAPHSSALPEEEKLKAMIAAAQSELARREAAKRQVVERPPWDQTFKRQYEALEDRSTCPRLHVACIAEREHQILASGFNGAPRGLPHCTEVGCLMVDGHCLRAVHDTQNLVAQAARIGVSLLGATFRSRYLPCTRCALLIIQTGMVEVVYEEIYGNGGQEATEFFCAARVKLRTIA